MNLQPINDKILVERQPEENKTAGGILLPDSAQKQSQWGTVLSVGSKVEVVSKGDMVFCGKYVGTDVDGVQFIIREEDVLMFVKKEDTDKI
jgi:chaperonin GroES